jgi:hypothetical protein
MAFGSSDTSCGSSSKSFKAASAMSWAKGHNLLLARHTAHRRCWGPAAAQRHVVQPLVVRLEHG